MALKKVMAHRPIGLNTKLRVDPAKINGFNKRTSAMTKRILTNSTKNN